MATTGTSVSTGAAMTNSQKSRLPGYYGFAEYMADIPERTHLRTFPELSNLELLRKQAELIDLKRQLYDRVASDDAAGDGVRSEYAKNWTVLLASRDPDNPGHLEFLEAMGQKLRDYHASLLQHHHILDLPPANIFDLDHLQEHLERHIGAGRDPPQADIETWGRIIAPKSFAADLVSLRSRHKNDGFSRWILDTVLPTIFGSLHSAESQNGRANRISEDTILRYTKLFTCVVSALLPFACILVLFFVDSAGKRLVVVGVSCLVFALALAVFTTARSSEYFLAICGLLAVEIVFLGAIPSPS